MRRLQEVSSRLVQAGDTDSLMKEILDAAIAITAADMGSIQLRDRGSDTLRIVASRRFTKPFLEFFAEVTDRIGPPAVPPCSAANASSSRT